jgi:hypothetical protein
MTLPFLFRFTRIYWKIKALRSGDLKVRLRRQGISNVFKNYRALKSSVNIGKPPPPPDGLGGLCQPFGQQLIVLPHKRHLAGLTEFNQPMHPFPFPYHSVTTYGPKRDTICSMAISQLNLAHAGYFIMGDFPHGLAGKAHNRFMPADYSDRGSA